MTRLEIMDTILNIGERGDCSPYELMLSCLTVSASICAAAGVPPNEFLGMAGEEYALVLSTANNVTARLAPVTTKEDIH